jgi:pimeloyl-ACP methyl ester carboxylesterase/predicted glycosyltransferase
MAPTTTIPMAGPAEQTRARYPDASGFVERDGVRVFWERYGDGEPTILLMPTWEIVHSRFWRCQIPYLARHCRVICFDPRGNGRSDRPRDPAAYDPHQAAEDAIAVLDANGVEQAVVVSWCGVGSEVILAAEHPDRVTSLVQLGPDLRVSPLPHEEPSFDDVLDSHEGWAKENRHYWLRDWQGYLEWFHSQCFIEAHSTKQIEDAVGWGLETDAETILAGEARAGIRPEELLAGVRCPVLLIQGTEDAIVGGARGGAVADRLADARLVLMEGSGHAPHLRDPVRFNLLLRDFAVPPPPPARWVRTQQRAKRVLYVSSPIGLGHARRDLAIVDQLRVLHPGLQVDWLAQHPVTEVLEARGERVHPASAELSNESHHFARESRGHELHCFQALRRMDEILLANFMVFHDVVRDEQYDLWVGDEAWELDHFLHENPELKRAPFAWLTDFVGYLPMPEGGEREAFLTADYNAEMIEHVARHPRIRDRAIFVGDPEDIVPDTFGPGLPAIRDWTERHFDFAGYVTGFDAAVTADRMALRHSLGYADDETVCVVSVGGSGVGRELLAKVIDAYPAAAARLPRLRMIAVAGPRIDPASLPRVDGVEVHAYVDGLYRHLAACDVAVVQGGLTTCMELTASRRPFLYFPLGGHFEQQRHVDHRLRRYGAGRRMDFERAAPDAIAAALADEAGRKVDYRPVGTDGAARAAKLIAELL